MLFKIKRIVCLSIINNFLSTTRYFRLKNILLNFTGIKIGINTKVVGPLRIGTVAQLIIGNNCWIGSGFTVYGNGVVNIGDNCDFAPDVAFITGSHKIGSAVRRAGPGTSYELYVENGCWIGARVSITGNTTIAKSSVIGACSFVNKSIAENVVAYGIPAKVVKQLQ